MTEALAGLAAVVAAVQRATVRIADSRHGGAGSGVLWRDRRTVVTNAHVVRGRGAVVRFADGTTMQSRVVLRDTERDLVALLLDAPAPAEPLRERDAASLRPGEIAIAVGNPLGLTGAAAVGIVHRPCGRFVVADLCLAPGNSGGPLVDAAGSVIGINSMIADGLALAVPTEAVRALFA